MNDASRATAISCLGGLAGYVLCFFLHVRPEGHAPLPPYGHGDRALDIAWAAAFLVAGRLSGASRLPRKNLFVLLLTLLVMTRFLLDVSGDLRVTLIEIGAVAYLASRAVELLREPIPGEES